MKHKMMQKIVLPILILVIGVGLTVVLIQSRKVPVTEEPDFKGPLVDVIEVVKQSRQVQVKGTGSVQARYATDVTPQVSGRIDWISPHMVAGGFFEKGETLFTIEAVDYQLALERAQASLAQADLELVQIQSQAEIARSEWERLQLEDAEEPNPLVLYEPQLKSAQASRASALAAVRQAELDLSRTRINAPFNCYVRSEEVDLGQYLRSGDKVATLAGTDAVEIVVPLPFEELAWLEVPRSGANGQGSPATVVMNFAGHQLVWQGEIVRALGDIDPRTRMASVVIAVTDPFERNNGKLIELAPGMFVETLLHGHIMDDVVPLPRGALRDGDTAWVVTPENTLEIRKVSVVRRERQEVMIGEGLSAGDRVVLTGVAAAANGMLLRPRLQEND